MISGIPYAISEVYLHLVNAVEHINVAELAPMMKSMMLVALELWL